MKQYRCTETLTGHDVIVNYDSTCMMVEIDGKFLVQINPEHKTFNVIEIGGN